MTTHFKSDAKPNETRSTTAACRGIARTNGFRRAAQLMVTADPAKVTCVVVSDGFTEVAMLVAPEHDKEACETNAADARLIAQAPAMLDAIRAFMETPAGEGQGVSPSGIDLAAFRAILAAIEGQS